MRTTLSLDDDVAAMIERLREERKLGLKEVVNLALREGLPRLSEPKVPREPYRTKAFDSGPCLLPSLDCYGEVLEQIEGPWAK